MAVLAWIQTVIRLEFLLNTDMRGQLGDYDSKVSEFNQNILARFKV